MKVSDIRPFIPSKDYQTSIEFYSDLEFSSDYVTDDLTLFENGNCTFFLQRFYNQQLCENLMFQMCVVDIESTFKVANSARHKQKITAIENERWGKVFYLWGPSGELWHVTQLARQ